MKGRPATVKIGVQNVQNWINLYILTIFRWFFIQNSEWKTIIICHRIKSLNWWCHFISTWALSPYDEHFWASVEMTQRMFDSDENEMGWPNGRARACDKEWTKFELLFKLVIWEKYVDLDYGHSATVDVNGRYLVCCINFMKLVLINRRLHNESIKYRWWWFFPLVRWLAFES